MFLFKILFYASGLIIFWAMVGYPTSLRIINKLYTINKLKKNYTQQPTVTVMVVAHNEEKVILDKLNNIIALDYPREKIKYLISSDNSTDKTNAIVEKFIEEHPNYNIQLYKVKDRKGKTNAQNEAHKLVDTEYLVMTDANAMLKKDAIKELMSSFISKDIAYVTGKLIYVNNDTNDISNAETSYWDSDLQIRDIESRIQTITAGNGALYACRTEDYVDFNPIKSHDSAMPLYYALHNKKAIANHDAIAYEKAGEVVEDEFGRKVRMNRILLGHILPTVKILNVFKYKWFSYFYFGHRTCRYLLWIAHFLLLISSLVLSSNGYLYLCVFLLQIIFYGLSVIKMITRTENKYLTLVYYYTVTIIAQWVGVYRTITGKSKPFWEKAESTR
ncbi:glycosyltransferase [Enterococcus alcedinis]|uniref:Glycosyl transferase n=1 Tax=Enterococcus alcedinis TaxID=1274384 RepID=A0A917JED5_9ENTE|nr:glycosyltransferase [Enterococcus alcedinis]MBP2102101.1 cellulose synthase/poly-beta-1,6-N-acetylglucosamine synthase-like glycosyltransferase [Enterococcus alcedinis]GGI65663.1 glycosyl transferase [Enterococcus alcedinis]